MPHTVLLSLCLVFLIASVAFFRVPSEATSTSSSASELDVRQVMTSSSAEVRVEKPAANQKAVADVPSAIRAIIEPRIPLDENRYGLSIPISIGQRALCTSNDFGAIYRKLLAEKIDDVLLTVERIDGRANRVLSAERIRTSELASFTSVLQIPRELATEDLTGIFLCTDPRRTGSCLGKENVPNASNDRALVQGGMLYFSPIKLSEKGLVIPSLSDEFAAIDAAGRIGSAAPRTKADERAWAAAKEIDRRQESLALRYLRGVFVVSLPVKDRGCVG